MRTYALLSDTELTERFNQRDEMAFEEIYNRFWGPLFAHARRMLKDDDQAEDVVQDIFMGMLDKRGQLEAGSLSGYLYKSVRNAIFNLMTREKVKVKYMDHLQHFLNEGVSQTDELIREKELREMFERELALLPPRMREIFELSRKAHLNYKEIAEQTNTTEGTVKKTIYNTLKVLKAKLGMLCCMGIMHTILFLTRFY